MNTIVKDMKVTTISLASVNAIKFNHLLSLKFELENRLDRQVITIKNAQDRARETRKQIHNLTRRLIRAHYNMEREMIQNNLLKESK